MRQSLTLQQFVEQAGRYGCVLKTTTVTVTGPRGVEKWEYLKRGDNFLAVLPNIDDDELLTPTQQRSLIDQLNLPALEFGLDFG